MCRWDYPGTWSADVADSWRTTFDIRDDFKRSVRPILAQNLYLSAYCKPGHYNDMDMLEVGRGMTQTEDETHFGMWCIMNSPLLIGCDLRNVRPESLKLMKNSDLIGINQDRTFQQAYLVKRVNNCYVLTRDVEKLNGLLAGMPLDTYGGRVKRVDFGAMFLSEDGTISTNLMYDLTHPTDKGYRMLGARLRPEIDAALKRYGKGELYEIEMH